MNWTNTTGKLSERAVVTNLLGGLEGAPHHGLWRYSPTNCELCELWNELKWFFAVGRAFLGGIMKQRWSRLSIRKMKGTVLLLFIVKLRRSSNLVWSPTKFVLEPTWLPTIMYVVYTHNTHTFFDYTLYTWSYYTIKVNDHPIISYHII